MSCALHHCPNTSTVVLKMPDNNVQTSDSELEQQEIDFAESLWLDREMYDRDSSRC
jgi:hypothetical protein